MAEMYKGFDKDLKCRDFQFEVGKEYSESGDIKCCENGFHCCENPFNVLDFYSIIDDDCNLNRFCEVEGSGKEDSDDKKKCYEKLTIKAEIGIKGLVSAMIKFVREKVKDCADSGDLAQICSLGDYAKIGSSGDYAQIGSSGDYAQIGSSGGHAQIGSSGDYAKIGSSGYSAKIGSSGDSAQIGSSGDYAQIGSSGYSARIGSSGYSARIGSSGYSAQIGSSGDSARIGSSGDNAKINSTGENSVICCAGYNCKVKAKKGSWITLAEWEMKDDKWFPKCVKTEFVDGERIKADVWYMLKDGEFTVCENVE